MRYTQPAMDVVILTASKKYGGLCVAGINACTGEWVRLVSGNRATHGAISESCFQYCDGEPCRVLDVARFPVVRPSPLPHQPENFLINGKEYPQKIGAWDLKHTLIRHPAETPRYIFANKNSYLTEDEMRTLDRSLLFVRVEHLFFYPVTYDGSRTKMKVNFFYEKEWYNRISVTDPKFSQAGKGEKRKEAYLAVSLPNDPYQDTGKYYKFVAGIFPTE